MSGTESELTSSHNQSNASPEKYDLNSKIGKDEPPTNPCLGKVHSVQTNVVYTHHMIPNLKHIGLLHYRQGLRPLGNSGLPESGIVTW